MRNLFKDNPTIRAVTFSERIKLFFLGACIHRWGSPRCRADVDYPAPYDSQQDCAKCAAVRLYDAKGMIPGPEFVQLHVTSIWKKGGHETPINQGRTVAGHAESPAQPEDAETISARAA
jgi:hypothetical protein